MVRAHDLAFLAHELAKVLDVLARDRVADDESRSVVKPGKVGLVGVITELGEEGGWGAGRVEWNPLVLVGVDEIDREGAEGRVGLAGRACAYPVDKRRGSVG